MRKHMILVADDDAPILRLVRAKLQTDGYAVVTATNGEEAVQSAERERPDLVVLDIMMPVVDGLEAMKRIRQVSNVPIILLTARASGADKIRGLDPVSYTHLTLPPSDLV